MVKWFADWPSNLSIPGSWIIPEPILLTDYVKMETIRINGVSSIIKLRSSSGWKSSPAQKMSYSDTPTAISQLMTQKQEIKGAKDIS